MSPQPITFEGVFKDGVLVPARPVKLPEGVTLTIAVFPPVMDPDLQAETADWERLSDEAWAMIDDWEREE